MATKRDDIAKSSGIVQVVLSVCGGSDWCSLTNSSTLVSFLWVVTAAISLSTPLVSMICFRVSHSLSDTTVNCGSIIIWGLVLQTRNFPVFPHTTAYLPKWCGKTGLRSKIRLRPIACCPLSILLWNFGIGGELCGVPAWNKTPGCCDVPTSLEAALRWHYWTLRRCKNRLSAQLSVRVLFTALFAGKPWYCLPHIASSLSHSVKCKTGEVCWLQNTGYID